MSHGDRKDLHIQCFINTQILQLPQYRRRIFAQISLSDSSYPHPMVLRLKRGAAFSSQRPRLDYTPFSLEVFKNLERTSRLTVDFSLLDRFGNFSARRVNQIALATPRVINFYFF